MLLMLSVHKLVTWPQQFFHVADLDLVHMLNLQCSTLPHTTATTYCLLVSDMLGAFKSEKPLQFHRSLLKSFSHCSRAILSALSSAGTRSVWFPQTYKLCAWVLNILEHSALLIHLTWEHMSSSARESLQVKIKRNRPQLCKSLQGSSMYTCGTFCVHSYMHTTIGRAN